MDKQAIEENLKTVIEAIENSDLSDNKIKKAIKEAKADAMDEIAKLTEDEAETFIEPQTLENGLQVGNYCMVHHEGVKRIYQNGKIFSAETKEFIKDLNK